MIVARGWGEGFLGEFLFNGTEFQFCQMKTILEMDGRDGCTTIRRYIILLNCTPKNGYASEFYVMCILMQ